MAGGGGEGGRGGALRAWDGELSRGGGHANFTKMEMKRFMFSVQRPFSVGHRARELEKVRWRAGVSETDIQ